MKILEHKSINKTFTSSKYTLLFREGRELWHYYNCKNGFLHKISIQNLLVFYQVPEEKSITLGIPVKARKIWDKMIFKITESNIWDLSILIPFSSIGTKRRLITLLHPSFRKIVEIIVELLKKYTLGICLWEKVLICYTLRRTSFWNLGLDSD